MDILLNQAKAGKFSFKVSCTIDPAGLYEKRATCDPLKVLRALSLRDLYRTEMKSELKKQESFVRQDELLVTSGEIANTLKISKDMLVAVRVEDEQHFGKQSVNEADILSAKIEISQMD
jgi:hypothetical protein